MDWTTKIISLVIGLVVGIVLVTSVLLPVVDGFTSTNETYTSLIGVIGLLAIVVLVVYAARAIMSKD